MQWLPVPETVAERALASRVGSGGRAWGQDAPVKKRQRLREFRESREPDPGHQAPLQIIPVSGGLKTVSQWAGSPPGGPGDQWHEHPRNTGRFTLLALMTEVVLQSRGGERRSPSQKVLGCCASVHVEKMELDHTSDHTRPSLHRLNVKGRNINK